MTNLLGTITYVDLEDAQETSSILADLSNDDATKALCEAEIAIDNYIQFYGVKADEDQTRIFPTESDGIPDEIKLATIWTAEQISLEGSSLGALRGDKVVAESNLSRSIAYSDKQSYNDYVQGLQLPKKVIKILDKYRNMFISQVI